MVLIAVGRAIFPTTPIRYFSRTSTSEKIINFLSSHNWWLDSFLRKVKSYRCNKKDALPKNQNTG
jgi:hypothetical protein